METYIHLEFLDYEKKVFKYLKINSQIIKIEKNYENIKLNYIKNSEHYLETIKLFNNEIDFIEYNIDIYINQINNYACLISSKNNYTFSVINYDNKKLLDKIEIKQNKNVYNLTLYDNNGLKYCRRFNIINCSLEYIKKNNFNVPEFLVSGSYNIDIFHNQISVHKLKEPIYYEIDFIKINKEDKDYLLSLESNLNKQYNILLNDKNLDDETKNIKFKLIIDNLINFEKKYKFQELEIIKRILSSRKNLELYEKDYNIFYAYAYFLVIKSLKTIDIGFAIYSIFLNLLNDLKTNIPNSFDIIRIIIWYKDNYIKNEQFEKKI